MKFFSKLKATALSAALLGASTLAAAGSFDNVNSNGQGFGKVSKSVASSLVDGAAMFEAFLYLAGIVFIVLFILTLVKWKKSDGREGSPGLIAIYLVASVLCIGAPTLMGGGLTTLFGTGTVSTVKAPSASLVGN
tara:strand:- start:808 stop:1212 length:405 start_codon:yes stop_codon:yes gene_type:complete